MKKILLFLLLTPLPAYAQEEAATPPPSPAASSGELQTYANEQYHFTLQYPKDFAVINTLTPTDDHVGCEKKICFDYTSKDVDYARFALDASTEPTSDECVNPETDSVSINNVTWYKKSGWENAGVMHSLKVTTYRTYYNGTCYEAYLSIASHVGGENDGPDHDSLNASEQELDSIIKTVRFTIKDDITKIKSSAVPPNWKPYTGKTIPISFDYPGYFMVWEQENHVTIGHGWKSGLETLSSDNWYDTKGNISIDQTDYHPSGNISKNEAILTLAKSSPRTSSHRYSYTPITLDGEPACIASNTGLDIGNNLTIYVAHGSKLYIINFDFEPLPQEYETFVKTFKFTSPD